MNTCVFLDLEETIIDSWHSGLLVNVQVLRDFLEKNNVTEVGIFSFAVYNDRDLEIFNRDHKPFIERALNVTITSCVTVEQMMKKDTAFTGIFFDNVSDFISVRGKKDAFINFVNGNVKFDKAMLIDDVVPNMTVRFNDLNKEIELVNVLKLAGKFVVNTPQWDEPCC